VIYEPGSVWVADLGDEARTSVMVLSQSRFNGVGISVVVAPAVIGELGRTPPTWIDDGEGTLYAVEHLVTTPAERLLELLDGSGDRRRIRTAIHAIFG